MARTPEKAPPSNSLGDWSPAPSVLALLPESQEELLEAADAALARLDASMRAGDAPGVREALDVVRAAAWRYAMNPDCDRTHHSATRWMEEQLATKAGQPGAWGRRGEWLMAVNGVRVWVRTSPAPGHASVELHAVDTDLPFLSQTGFRSHFFPLNAGGESLPAVVASEIGRLLQKPVYIEQMPEEPLPEWLQSIDPPPRRMPPPSNPKESAPMERSVSLQNASLEDVELPTMNVEAELTPGSVKAIKASTRRSDAFIYLSLDRLTVMEDFNVRVESPDYQARIRAIADDMKENGFRVDKPISCYVDRQGDEDRVVVFDGHTRRKAAMLAIEEGAEIVDEHGRSA